MSKGRRVTFKEGFRILLRAEQGTCMFPIGSITSPGSDLHLLRKGKDGIEYVGFGGSNKEADFTESLVDRFTNVDSVVWVILKDDTIEWSYPRKFWGSTAYNVWRNYRQLAKRTIKEKQRRADYAKSNRH